MDPTAALAEILKALRDGDRPTALERLADLYVWLSAEGFMPDVDAALRACTERRAA